MKFSIVLLSLFVSLQTQARFFEGGTKPKIQKIKSIWMGLKSPEAFENLGEIYAQDVNYIDPFLDNAELFPKEAKNLGLLKKYWLGIYYKYSAQGLAVEFRVSNPTETNAYYTTQKGKVLFVHWDMWAVSIRTGQEIKKITTGFAEIHFNEEGKIEYQKDHMDMSIFLEKEGITLKEMQQRLHDVLIN